MKKLILLLLLVLPGLLLTAQNPVTDFFTKTDQLLKKRVIEGRIDYKGVKESPSRLKELVALIGEMDFEKMPDKQQLAFLINTYNILVIESVVENYPIASPMDVDGFFDKQKHWVGGKKFTLNQIENELIREPFKDARIHFVLVCAAKSCPPIVDYAYTAENLDKQLNERTRASMNDKTFIRPKNDEKKVLVSEIFKWYKEDFYWDHDGILDYINAYRSSKIPEEFSVGYYTYDWSLNEAFLKQSYAPDVPDNKSNIQEYTPSKLLKKGQIETQLFNNLYTQTSFRNGDRDIVYLNRRETYYTGLYYFLYGISENSKVNIGFDVNIRSVRIDPDTTSSALAVFAFDGPPVGRTAISTIGPKIKIKPFQNLAGFSFQSAFWIPVAKNLEGVNSDKPWLDFDMFTWWNQFFYDYQLSEQFQLFTEIDLLFRFDKDFEMQRTQLLTPVSFFLNYFPWEKLTFYANAQYAPEFRKEVLSQEELGNIALTSDYAQAGLGMKYQLTSSVNLELSYSNFFTAMNQGNGNTYNFGIRYIH